MLWVLAMFLAPGAVMGRGGRPRARALGDWGWVLVLVSGYLHTLILGRQPLVYTVEPLNHLNRLLGGSNALKCAHAVLALSVTSAKMKVPVVTGTSRGHCGFGS